LVAHQDKGLLDFSREIEVERKRQEINSNNYEDNKKAHKTEIMIIINSGDPAATIASGFASEVEVARNFEIGL